MIKHIVLALTFAAVCASVQAGAYKDGTYIGEGNGNASKIQVEVVVSGGKIASVNVLKHGETEPLLKAAQKKPFQGHRQEKWYGRCGCRKRSLQFVQRHHRGRQQSA